MSIKVGGGGGGADGVFVRSKREFEVDLNSLGDQEFMDDDFPMGSSSWACDSPSGDPELELTLSAPKSRFRKRDSSSSSSSSALLVGAISVT